MVHSRTVVRQGFATPDAIGHQAPNAGSVVEARITAATPLSSRSFPGWPEKKRARKTAEVVRFLLPDESIIYFGPGSSLRPAGNELVITNVRVFTYLPERIAACMVLDSIADMQVLDSKRTLSLTDHAGRAMKVRGFAAGEAPHIQAALEAARASPRPSKALDAIRHAEETAAEAARVAAMTMHERWPRATILGKQTRKGEEAIKRLSLGEEAPWLVLAPGFAQGLLVAFEDRLAIIKTGAATSFMAGSLGGERSTTFYFTDINAIEYNSGIASGVLEVLTASYQGSANKDFWRGTMDSRNADKNDPYTLSNTLPMAKVVYNEWSSHIQELRARISASKRPASIVMAPAPRETSSDLVSQLERLSALRAADVLTDEEFVAAKARLMKS
ncbi:hypothetical protein [Microbacterium galbinum]|uniref:hypothetical protein n=1 Tax=Microbacterium galbinum TaxID=2851646 RepID=UPI001FFCD8CF|nr:hypothetical protein [Microbacterium galbinum]